MFGMGFGLWSLVLGLRVPRPKVKNQRPSGPDNYKRNHRLCAGLFLNESL
jgi:hypothetical protein